MQASKVLLLLLALYGLLAIKLSHAGLLSSPQKYYDEIESYLTKTVNSNDVDENMAKSVEWLAELESERKGCFSLTSSSSLVKNLKQLLQLRTVLGEDKCNLETYKILSKNDEKAGYPVSNHREESTRRIDLIVKYYARKHSDACLSVWPQKLADKMKEVSPRSMDYVMKFVEQSHFPWDCRSRGRLYIKLLRDYNEADVERQKMAAKERFNYQKEMVFIDDYRRYILDPCDEVRSKVSDELYEPIKFDISVHRRDLEFWDDEHKEFRRNRLIMDWCEYIHVNEGPIWDKIYDIMKSEKRAELSVIWA